MAEVYTYPHPAQDLGRGSGSRCPGSAFGAPHSGAYSAEAPFTLHLDTAAMACPPTPEPGWDSPASDSSGRRRKHGGHTPKKRRTGRESSKEGSSKEGFPKSGSPNASEGENLLRRSGSHGPPIPDVAEGERGGPLHQPSAAPAHDADQDLDAPGIPHQPETEGRVAPEIDVLFLLQNAIENRSGIPMTDHAHGERQVRAHFHIAALLQSSSEHRRRGRITEHTEGDHACASQIHVLGAAKGRHQPASHDLSIGFSSRDPQPQTAEAPEVDGLGPAEDVLERRDRLRSTQPADRHGREVADGQVIVGGRSGRHLVEPADDRGANLLARFAMLRRRTFE